MTTANEAADGSVNEKPGTRPAAEDVALDRVHAWPRNPHPPSEKNVREIMQSIRRFGFGEPILARRENGEIIAGHARFLAATTTPPAPTRRPPTQRWRSGSGCHRSPYSTRARATGRTESEPGSPWASAASWVAASS